MKKLNYITPVCERVALASLNRPPVQKTQHSSNIRNRSRTLICDYLNGSRRGLKYADEPESQSKLE